MSQTGFIVYIPETGCAKLIAFMDKEFPYCSQCHGRYDPDVPGHVESLCQECNA